MDKLIIKGANPLKGDVSISGAKNAVLPMLCASVMASKTNVTIRNVPHLHDVTTTLRLLSEMGCTTSMDEMMSVQLDPSTINNLYAPYDLVKTMRASILVLGPLLSRYGHAKVSLPGGCAIGTRPVGLHLDALTKMGAEISIDNGYITAHCKNLKGCNINFPTTTVTGTENILMASCLAKGTTIISNAAMEPEVIDLANFLIGMGADISGQGTSVITVNGVDELHGISYSALPDRIETGTFLVAAAITGGRVTLKNAIYSHVEIVIDTLREAGAEIHHTDNTITIDMKKQRPKPVEIETGPYPQFPTDMQAQLTALSTIATGVSIIKENIFENRFMHVPELLRMGADIRVNGGTAMVRGRKSLTPAPVMATDLRASVSLVLAALATPGISQVSRIYHLERGYSDLEKKLGNCGAKLRRVKR